MRSTLCWMSLVALVLAPPPAAAGTSVGVSVTVADAPPPPTLVFRQPPRMVVVPGSTVYIVERDCGYDLFRYGVYWYVFHDEHWYRARSHRGPFTSVRHKYVPAAIVNVPARYWRHHQHGPPPRLAKKRGEAAMVVHERERRRRDD